MWKEKVECGLWRVKFRGVRKGGRAVGGLDKSGNGHIKTVNKTQSCEDCRPSYVYVALNS